MDSNTWLLIAILTAIVLLLVIALVIRRKKKIPTDYYTLFLAGIVWFVLGFPLGNYALSVIGLVFIIIGLKNKDKWKKNRKKWDKLSRNERIIRITLSFILGLLIAVLLVFLLLRIA